MYYIYNEYITVDIHRYLVYPYIYRFINSYIGFLVCNECELAPTRCLW